MANWLSKYEQGGLVLKQKTKDNYGKRENPNDVKASVGPDFVGLGYDTKGRNYSPAWEGQFQNGGVMNKASMFASLPTPTDIYNYGRRESEEIAKRAKLMWESKSLNPTLPMHSDTLYPGNKYKDAFMKTPNIRTKKDESFKKGHSLTNEQKAIVLHHTGYTDTARDNDVSWAMRGVDAQFRKPGESSHVVIDFNGNRYNYANPNQVTFHAGKSSMNNKNDVNDFGVGVEFQGDTDQRPLTKEQIESFIEYAAPIIKKNNIPINNVITHKQIRKNYIDKNLNDKDVQSKPDVNDKEYSKIIQALKKKDVLQMGGSIPGAVGFMYARTQDPAPSNGPYAKKTKASAQNGSVIKDDRGQLAYPGEITQINSNNITMQGVDYPVLGVSDTGDTQMMQPGQDYKFDGEKVTEYPMMQKGGWLDKYPEPMRQDATRVAPPVLKLTDKEKLENAAKYDQGQKKALNTAKEVIAERQKNKATKGDINTPGSWHLEDKARLFPSSVGGAGEMFDEYVNPATYVGILGDALGESVAARDPKGIAKSLALSAVGGALGFDPLGGAIKTAKSFVKPSFANGKEALDFLQNTADKIGEENLVNVIAKKTGKTKQQIEDEFTQAVGNADAPRDPEFIIRHANIVNGKFNLPKFPKSLKELDETAGKLVSSPNKVDFDKTEIINRANELLEKGVGIKKKNIPVKLESTPGSEIIVKVNDNNPQYLNDYNKSGYMNLSPNFSGMDTKSATFTDWLQGKKPETKFVTNWGNIEKEPAFTKIGDFPYDRRPDLKGTGIGAEAAEAVKQALEEKGIKLKSSTSHTEEGRLRYLTEFLNDRKKAINTEGNPGWIDIVNNIKESLKGKKVSKEEVKNLMNLNPNIDPKSIQFQYKDGGWLDKYK